MSKGPIFLFFFTTGRTWTGNAKNCKWKAFPRKKKLCCGAVVDAFRKNFIIAFR